MKHPVEKKKPAGIADYVALALTTWGVGYIPGAPGTYASAIGVLIYLAAERVFFIADSVFSRAGMHPANVFSASVWITGSVLLLFLFLVGIWASGRSIPLLGNDDPHSAVVDEVMGQLITFCFIPFGLGWPFIVAGFLLFRCFDIWKPYPINDLQILPGGLGICADDIVAGVYAGICLAAGYAVTLWI